MRQNTPRLWLLLASLSTLVLSLDLPSHPALAATDGAPISGLRSTNPQKSQATILRTSPSTSRKSDSTTAAKPHRLIRQNNHAPVDRATGNDPSLFASPTVSVPSPIGPADSQSIGNGPMLSSPSTATPLMSGQTPQHVPSTLSATPAGSNSSAFAGPLPLSSRSRTAMLSGSNEDGEPPTPMRRLMFAMPKLTQLLRPPSPEPPQEDPSIGASPMSFSFTAQGGGPAPSTQTLTISNIGGGTLNWTATDDAAWLTLSPASGINNGTVILTAIPGTLATGTHTATLTVTSIDTAPVSIPVTFTITTKASPPAIGASPTSISFTAQQGSGNPDSRSLNISNTGGGSLAWTASEGASWLNISPSSGTDNGTITLTAVTGSLTTGTHNTTVTLRATGASTVTVPVSVTITAPPAISISPSSLSFTTTQGAANPSPKTFSIRNTGGGTLTWSLTDNQGWLTMSSQSGTTTTETDPITVSVNTSGLQPNTYNASITVTVTGASPTTIPVSVTVTAQPAISISPSSLSFTATQGAANPSSKTFSIRNTGSGTLTWSLTDNQSWLTVNSSSGTTTTETDSVTVSINTGSLQADTYNASIIVAATGASNTPQTIPVTLTLNPPATSSATLMWDPNQESDLASYRVYRSNTQGVYGAPVAVIPAGTVTYQATGLQTGQTYWFTVTAVDSQGNESTYSNEVQKSIF